jgi:hypothetical protein
MSFHKALALLVALTSFTFLIACGGNGSTPANPTPPPTGGFSNSNLNGTYVFSVSGVDASGDSLAILGKLSANGSGTITGGAIDMNDSQFTTGSFANLPVSSSSYNITVDGRGQTQLNVPSGPFGKTLTLDFVLQDNSHGLISEFDSNGTGSGTIDLQTSASLPTGPFAFIFSGEPFATASPFASVGNFTVASGGAIAGVEDFNESGNDYASQSLAGKIVLGPSSTPSTVLTTGQFGTQTYDAIAIDSTHLKFIEMDQFATFSGDAFSEPSTTLPAGNFAFTVEGEGSNGVVTAGGVLATDGSGNITSASSADSNSTSAGPSVAAVGFGGTYAATSAGSARYQLTLTSFPQGTTYVAYPISGGLILMELDTSGVLVGVAYTQSAGAALAASEGYALNFSGENISSGSATEVDDIAEFTTASGGSLTGIIDENSLVQTVVSLALTGTYSASQLSATAGTSSSSTLNGGFLLDYFPVDGTTFPFIEMDSGQVSTGVFIEQSSTGSSSAIARPHAMYVPHPLVHPHGNRQRKQ